MKGCGNVKADYRYSAEILYSARNPTLLHKRYHLLLLIIRDAHQRVMYNEVKVTLIEIRLRFWITRMRKLVKSLNDITLS